VTVTTTRPRIQDPAGTALTPVASLGIFRSCLAALSEPGHVGRLDPDAEASPAVSILLALTDLTTPVAVLAGDARLRLALGRALAASGAPLVGVGTGTGVGAAAGAGAGAARYVLAVTEPSAEELAAVSVGTDLDPHLGALIVVGVDSLQSGAVAEPGDALVDGPSDALGDGPADGAADELSDAPAEPGDGGTGVASTVARLTLELTGPGVATTRLVRVAGLTRRFVDHRNTLVEAPPRGIDLLLVTPTGELVGLPRTTAITVQAATR
jgi:phosphonate C-P lyase system protein PhnH